MLSARPLAGTDWVVWTMMMLRTLVRLEALFLVRSLLTLRAVDVGCTLLVLRSLVMLETLVVLRNMLILGTRLKRRVLEALTVTVSWLWLRNLLVMRT